MINDYNYDPKRWRPWRHSRASCANRAWHAPRPRAWVVAVEATLSEAFADTAQDLQRAAGAWGAPSLGASPCLWGARRPTGGRCRAALARGRRRSHRVVPRGAAPDPNLLCSVLLDYAGDGLYAMTLVERGAAPVVAKSSSDPSALLRHASRFLQPGLIASVSEGFMLVVQLEKPTWTINGPGPRGADLGGAASVPNPSSDLAEGRMLERVARAGDRAVEVSWSWMDAVFGPPLSKRKWRRLRHAFRMMHKELRRRSKHEREAEG
jgi:hypothetical protein